MVSITEKHVTIAPFALARINLFPTSIVDELVLFETLSIFEEIKEVEERLEEIRGAVEAILFRLVSELKDEHTFRRTVLSLKRDVFNQRKPKATEESIHEILNFLPKHEQSQVKQWLESINYNESLRLKAQSTFKDEVDRASK